MNDYRPVAISANEEPLLSNRWALKLPDELKVEYYHVHSIGAMKYDIKKGRWNPVQIKIREMVGGDARTNFAKMLDFFGQKKKRPTLELQLLDAVCEKVRGMYIEEYEVMEVRSSDLDYSNDGLFLSSLIIQPISVTIGEGEGALTYRNRKKFGLW